MRSRERKRATEAEPELFPKTLCGKGASDPTDPELVEGEGGGASDFGITASE